MKSKNKMGLKVHLLIFSVALSTFSIAQDSLTLFDAIQTGLENNYSIIIQRNNARITANNNTYGNAGFLPTVDARCFLQ